MSHNQDRPLTPAQRLCRAGRAVIRHGRKHVGVGLICSIAYFDPGNWGVDLQAGSTYGYRLLFVVLVAGLIAVFLQVLATKLGCVTGLDLASHCRLLLHSHPKYPRTVRFLALYPLYVLSEVAIISTDLAELLGSAMALCMLFPKLQIWQGVLITAGDVLFLLALKDPLRGRPVRMFEFTMACLVLAILLCMCIIIAKVDVQWTLAFQGYLPSKYIFPNGAFYTSVGILGATIMPHSLFLGSALATQDRESSSSPSTSSNTYSQSSPGLRSEDVINSSATSTVFRIVQSLRLTVSRGFRVSPETRNSYGTNYNHNVARHKDWENNSFDFVSRHLYHGIVDMVGSLLGCAVVINSIILAVSSAVFFYSSGPSGARSEKKVAGLFDAYDLIGVQVGTGAAKLFAVALLAAGQSSSIVATISGQVVTEGFLKWRASPIVRRLFTRIIAIVPAMVIAISLGRPGINSLLVVSQVILSVVLPFISLPLLYFTSFRKFMTVKKQSIPFRAQSVVASASKTGVDCGSCNSDSNEQIATSTSNLKVDDSSPPDDDGTHGMYEPDGYRLSSRCELGHMSSSGKDAEFAPVHDVEEQFVDYSNNLCTTSIACAVWLLISAANVYVLVALGNS